MLRGAAATGLHGAVRAFYRPEDIELGPPGRRMTPAGDGLAAHIVRIVRTRPLARIILDSDPPITALMLHREVDRLRLTDGDLIQATLPPSSLRVFQAH